MLYHYYLILYQKYLFLRVFGSAYFDNDGTTLKDKELIKDGKITSFFGSKRFAEYTNNEVTGNLEVIEIKGGSKTIEELKKEKQKRIIQHDLNNLPNHLLLFYYKVIPILYFISKFI